MQVNLVKFKKKISRQKKGEEMFNLIKDEFDENADDILESINKMLEKKKQEKKEDEKNKGE